MARRAGRRRKLERVSAKRAAPTRRAKDTGTPEQQLKRAAVVAGYIADKQKSFLGDPLGLMKLKGLISAPQEQAGYRFARIYGRIFGTLRVTSPPFDQDYGRGRALVWEQMSREAQDSLAFTERGLNDALGQLSVPERAVLSRYILTDSLPEWLYAHRRESNDELWKLEEFRTLWSALEKLSNCYGLA